MAEKEYIDLYECRDDFYATVLDILSEDNTNDRANQIIDAFDCLPAADVVPVVHCKNCEYNNECSVQDFGEMHQNDFCSRGNRRSDNG